jgi:hypothetical protein
MWTFRSRIELQSHGDVGRLRELQPGTQLTVIANIWIVRIERETVYREFDSRVHDL